MYLLYGTFDQQGGTGKVIQVETLHQHAGRNGPAHAGAKDKYPTSLIQYFLSVSEVELLQKNEHVKIINDLIIYLESSFTITKVSSVPVLFVVYGWSEIIPKIKKVIGIKSLIVLAPNEEEAAIWRKEFIE